MLIPKVIVSKMVYRQLLSHVRSTDFQYETGGVLLGYKFLRMFYIAGITFPRHFESATRTTFILNGEEHSEDVEKIKRKIFPHSRLIGVWHSHTTQDNTFSLQDQETNKLLAGQIGRMLSIIVIGSKPNDIRLAPYYISPNSKEFLCKYIIQGEKSMSKQTECCSNCVYWVHRKCSVTGEVKNDGSCTCGSFKPRS